MAQLLNRPNSSFSSPTLASLLLSTLSIASICYYEGPWASDEKSDASSYDRLDQVCKWFWADFMAVGREFRRRFGGICRASSVGRISFRKEFTVIKSPWWFDNISAPKRTGEVSVAGDFPDSIRTSKGESISAQLTLAISNPCFATPPVRYSYGEFGVGSDYIIQLSRCWLGSIRSCRARSMRCSSLTSFIFTSD